MEEMDTTGVLQDTVKVKVIDEESPLPNVPVKRIEYVLTSVLLLDVTE
jgi:hypothetical protein